MLSLLTKFTSYFKQTSAEPEVPTTPPSTYDKDHTPAYEAKLKAEKVLFNKGVKGMRQPSDREANQANQTKFNYEKRKAQEFLAEYQKLIAYYGLQIEGSFEQLSNSLIKPSLRIATYIPKEAEPTPSPVSVDDTTTTNNGDNE